MDQPESEWKRNCPECKREIIHMLECTRDNAIKLGKLCRSCGCKKSKANWTDEDRKRIGAKLKISFAARSPEQKAEHRRKQRATLAAWDDDKKRVRSERKRAYNLEHFKGEGNPFYGKKHTPEAIEKFKQRDVSYTKTPEFAAKVRAAMIGVNTSHNVMQIWIDRYGVEEAQRLEAQRRKRLSVASSGEGNPMFGRPSPRPSGGGVKGWYGEHFFRSLRELAFMLQLDKEGKRWQTGEASDFVVSYTNPYTGNAGTYRPDFIVEDLLMVECKPVNLQGTVIVQAKANAARTFCEQRDMTYVFVDPQKLTWDELYELVESSVVKLTDRTKEKLDANAIHPARDSWVREIHDRCRNDSEGTEEVCEDQSRRSEVHGRGSGQQPACS